MICPDCKSDVFERGRFDIAQTMYGRPVLLLDVTGRRCVQCGYILLSASMLRKIQKQVARGSGATTAVEVHDFGRRRRVPTSGTTAIATLRPAGTSEARIA